MATAPLIMIIRHAEKPVHGFHGIAANGAQSKYDLIVDGWQRAGALSPFFAPSVGPLQNSLLQTPQFLFGASPSATDDDATDTPSDTDSKSNRPIETITPLAAKLGLTIDQTYGKGDESGVATAAMALSGPVLICWQHQDIWSIASNIVNGSLVPKTWPGDRFDIVYVFTLGTDGTYTFAQAPQLLLSGDSADLIPLT